MKGGSQRIKGAGVELFSDEEAMYALCLTIGASAAMAQNKGVMLEQASSSATASLPLIPRRRIARPRKKIRRCLGSTIVLPLDDSQYSRIFETSDSVSVRVRHRLSADCLFNIRDVSRDPRMARVAVTQAWSDESHNAPHL